MLFSHPMRFIFAALFLCTSFANATEITPHPHAITYTFSGGRFGDNLLAYMHAKWISYRYQIPLLYKPFSYSDQLALHNIEISYSDALAATFSKKVELGYGANVDTSSFISTLYTLPYFPECKFELETQNWPYFEVDWTDEGFRQELRSLIQPVAPLASLSLPSDRVSVALHVRRGGGYDSPYSERLDPLKFPPLGFYTEQLKRLSDLLDNPPLYVHIFTDEMMPHTLVNFFKKELASYDIVYAYRAQGNNHSANVLEDFFALLQFDCLIRPESNFSISASKLVDYQVMIHPVHFTIKRRTPPQIDQVEIFMHGKKI